jgi:hypothetical protein
MKRFLNFNNAEIFFISFCSFWSFGVYGPSSSMVDDYTERERRKTEREREREREMFSPLHHGRPYNTERRSIV